MVVLNTISVAADLLGKCSVTRKDLFRSHVTLDRKSQIYSDRPRIILAGEMMCGDMFMPFRSYGDLYDIRYTSKCPLCSNTLLEIGGTGIDERLKKVSVLEPSKQSVKHMSRK